MHLASRICLGLALAALIATHAAAQQIEYGSGLGGLPSEPPDMPAVVEEGGAPDPVRPGSWTSVPVRFACEPGFYIRHASVKAALTDPPAGFAVAGVGLPEPREKYDDILKQTVAYLDGEFVALARIDCEDDVAPGNYDLSLKVQYTVCGPDLCRFEHADIAAILAVDPEAPAAGPATAEPPSPTESAPAVPLQTEDDPFAGHSPLVVVLIAFGLGLLLTLTPCVYPLIPVTIGVVGATASGRLDAFLRSMVYVLGISITYSAVGVAAAATGSLFGQIANHPAVYISLAVIFVLLAGGMFDVYTIDVTSQRLQRAQAGLRGKAGLVGVLIIGVLSGAAATACIAPVIFAALSYVATSGNLLLGWAIFFAMAWGMGTPLVLVGTFAGLAQSLPRSGQWMVTVKHVLGFVLLGCAVWFVIKSALLPEPWPSMLLGGFLLVSSVFVGAFDALGTDSDWRPRLRKAIGLLLLAGAVAVFMQPVMTAAPAAGGAAAQQQGVDWLTSEEEALALAQSQDKPVLLDFWEETCAPCILMFKTTYVDPRVVAESRRFVCAKIDVDELSDEQIDRVRETYGLRGVPMTVFIGTDGSRKTVTEMIKPDEMVEILRSIR
jgi:thiol:disulfide interchange protein DsbD